MKLLQERLAYVYKERPDLEGDRGQIGLARAAGASRSVANQWLNGGIKSIDILYALNIEAALGFSHIWLMTGLGEPMIKPGAHVSVVTTPPEPPPRMTLATSAELDLLDLYRRSTDRGQVSIVAAAKDAPKRRTAKLAGDKP
jgi:hypothetical protein